MTKNLETISFGKRFLLGLDRAHIGGEFMKKELKMDNSWISKTNVVGYSILTKVAPNLATSYCLASALFNSKNEVDTISYLVLALISESTRHLIARNYEKTMEDSEEINGRLTNE